MISVENRRLIEAIKAPEEHAELISTVVEAWKQYAKQKGYYPFKIGEPVGKYFCAYKQGAAPKGQGGAIVGFENFGEGLCLIFHHVVFDSKGLTVQTSTDKENRRRRIRIDRAFDADDIQHICKLSFQCIDKVFR